jgi:hypothetical protein
MIIVDGRGTGSKSRVDGNNRLHVQSVVEDEGVHSIEAGDAYNINTGNLSYSAAGTMLYLLNNEDRNLVVQTLAVGIGTGTVSDIPEITIIRNPTGGDLISDQTAVSINQNRNAGSTKTLSATVYSGKSSGTITGGNDWLYFYQNITGRLAASIDLFIPKGSSIAVKIDPKLSAGTVKAYAALVCYLKDPESSD